MLRSGIPFVRRHRSQSASAGSTPDAAGLPHFRLQVDTSQFVQDGENEAYRNAVAHPTAERFASSRPLFDRRDSTPTIHIADNCQGAGGHQTQNEEASCRLSALSYIYRPSESRLSSTIHAPFLISSLPCQSMDKPSS